jgi:hypothetical protein
MDTSSQQVQPIAPVQPAQMQPQASPPGPVLVQDTQNPARKEDGEERFGIPPLYIVGIIVAFLVVAVSGGIVWLATSSSSGTAVSQASAAR